jgi:hypothetical protein
MWGDKLNTCIIRYLHYNKNQTNFKKEGSLLITVCLYMTKLRTDINYTSICVAYCLHCVISSEIHTLVCSILNTYLLMLLRFNKVASVKWWLAFEMSLLILQSDILCAVKSYHKGLTALLPPERKAYCGFLLPLKSIALAGSELRTLCPTASVLITEHYTTEVTHCKPSFGGEVKPMS